MVMSTPFKLYRTFTCFCLKRFPTPQRGQYLDFTPVANSVNFSALPLRSTAQRHLHKISVKDIFGLPLTSVVEMASKPRTLEYVEQALNGWLRPKILGESWDNIGLLVGSGKYEKSEKNIDVILLCNDLMPAVLEEAISKNADMILAYHPPIFTGMKAISYGSWKERIVARCIANDISIYSPHTTLDSTVGGINDRVLDAFKSGNNETSQVKAIIPSNFLTDDTQGVVYTSTAENIRMLLDTVPFHSYSDVLITLRTEDSAVSLSVYSKSNLNVVCSLVSNAGIADLTMTESDVKPIFGAGRSIELNEPVELDQAIESVKKHLGLGYLQLAYGGNPTVKSAAVCVGSGSSLLKPLAGKIDLLITGEMSHHDILECVAKKSSVIVCNHCNSERHYLPRLAETLKVVTGVADIIVSENDCSPLRLVL